MPATPLADCIEAFASGLEPPPSLSVSAWADAHRMLPPTSAEPGPWLTSRAPYLREIMDRLSPGDPCETVVIMKGAQLGLTSVAENWMGHAIHIDPGPALLVQPTWNTARDYARDRINPLISETPILHTIVGEQRSRRAGTTTTRKTFPGGFLVITGANSAAELRAKAIRRLVLDEVDGYPLDVDGEGRPGGAGSEAHRDVREPQGAHLLDADDPGLLAHRGRVLRDARAAPDGLLADRPAPLLRAVSALRGHADARVGAREVDHDRPAARGRGLRLSALRRGHRGAREGGSCWPRASGARPRRVATPR
jgi:hypothetical protein